MNRQQMEMSFDNSLVLRPSLGRRRRRLTRAHWWFAQMRGVVDRATDGQPVAPARPEQFFMPLSRAHGGN
jgi:hypothetical protein